MVAPNDDDPRKRASNTIAQIQAVRAKFMPNPPDRVRLAEGAYLAARLSTRFEDAKTDDAVQLAELAYKGAIRQAMLDSGNTVVASDAAVDKILGNIDMIINNRRFTEPRTHAHRRDNDMGPGHH